MHSFMHAGIHVEWLPYSAWEISCWIHGNQIMKPLMALFTSNYHCSFQWKNCHVIATHVRMEPLVRATKTAISAFVPLATQEPTVKSVSLTLRSSVNLCFIHNTSHYHMPPLNAAPACDAALCNNRGTCIGTPTAFTCDCEPGYIGTTCEAGDLSLFPWIFIQSFCHSLGYHKELFEIYNEALSNPLKCTPTPYWQVYAIPIHCWLLLISLVR